MLLNGIGDSSFNQSKKGRPGTIVKIYKKKICTSKKLLLYLKICILLNTSAEVKWSCSCFTGRERILLSLCRLNVTTLACLIGGIECVKLPPGLLYAEIVNLTHYRIKKYMFLLDRITQLVYFPWLIIAVTSKNWGSHSFPCCYADSTNLFYCATPGTISITFYVWIYFYLTGPYGLLACSQSGRSRQDCEIHNLGESDIDTESRDI